MRGKVFLIDWFSSQPLHIQPQIQPPDAGNLKGSQGRISLGCPSTLTGGYHSFFLGANPLGH